MKHHFLFIAVACLLSGHGVVPDTEVSEVLRFIPCKSAMQTSGMYVDASVRHFPDVGHTSSSSFCLISHGRPGALYLDGKWRDVAGIVAFLKRRQLMHGNIRRLNILGCAFAKGVKGWLAMQYLEQLLGVAIAASGNNTGKNGDWLLEVGATCVTIKGLEEYNYNLQCPDGAVGGTAPSDDFDGDEVCNNVDIDDDNDGVLDEVESPGCFYTATEMNVISTITSSFVSPDDLQLDGDIQILHDGDDEKIFNFVARLASLTPQGSNIFTITYTIPVRLGSLSVSDNISSTVNANAVVVGSNDGTSWSDALSASTLITTTPVTFTINTTQAYKYYRIQTGTVSGAFALSNTIGEITSTLRDDFVSSANPKNTCSNDTDDDGLLNHQDLDSDGDVYSDAIEAAVANTSGTPAMDAGTLRNGSGGTVSSQTTTTNALVRGPYGGNGFANSIETQSESGKYNGTYTYNPYAIDVTMNIGGQGLFQVLPVRLLEFIAWEASNTVMLRWKTTAEINNDYFDVERSANGTYWQAIGKVKGKNSPGIYQYDFADANPLAGANYYRLQQRDFDGKYSYSAVRLVKVATILLSKIYPNPAQNYTIVAVPSLQQSDLTVWDERGRNITGLLPVKQLADGVFYINTTLLMNGLYRVNAGGKNFALMKLQ